MPTHAEQRVLPYTPEQLFALVADIERYPEFLPWCIGARIKERQTNLVVADLIIGFKVFRERFTSRVALDPPRNIDVTYAEGPFRYLNNHWTFDPGRRGLPHRLLCRFRVQVAVDAKGHRDPVQRSGAPHGRRL